jgi:hypothetical protein
MTTSNPVTHSLSKAKYEQESRGKVLMRVQLTPTDDIKEWETVKKSITAKFGTAKKGILELYLFALKSGVFSNSEEMNVGVKQKYSPLSKAPKDNEDGILIFDTITDSWVISFWRNKKDFDVKSSCWTDKDMYSIKGSVWTHLPTRP